MTTAPKLQNQPYRIPCATIWGGIEPVTLDVCTKGVTASLHSTASGGERGGDIYYMSVCSIDLLTRMVVADVRGHGEQVSEISSWIYQCLQDKMNSLDGAGVLSDLSRMIHGRGFAAITTAAVVSHYISDSTLYLGFLFARTLEPQDAESSLRRAHAALSFDILSALPVVKA